MLLLLGHICGDQCFDFDHEYKCECGGTTFISTEDFHLYCCIPLNDTCKTLGM